MITFQRHPEFGSYLLMGRVKLGYFVNSQQYGWVFNPMPDTSFKPETVELISVALADLVSGKELDGLVLTKNEDGLQTLV
jgi:hypothetical protein